MKDAIYAVHEVNEAEKSYIEDKLEEEHEDDPFVYESSFSLSIGGKLTFLE